MQAVYLAQHTHTGSRCLQLGGIPAWQWRGPSHWDERKWASEAKCLPYHDLLSFLQDLLSFFRVFQIFLGGLLVLGYPGFLGGPGFLGDLPVNPVHGVLGGHRNRRAGWGRRWRRAEWTILAWTGQLELATFHTTVWIVSCVKWMMLAFSSLTRSFTASTVLTTAAQSDGAIMLTTLPFFLRW